jgi:hypothetical protein
MSTKTTVKRVVQAVLLEDDEVIIGHFDRTTVKDASGRVLHGKGGDGPRTNVLKLSKREACDLLRSLVDAVAFIAEES